MKRNPLPSVKTIKGTFEYLPDSGRLIWRDSSEDAGRKNSSGYVYVRTGPTQRFMAHRIIWKLMTGEEPAFDIDHKNGDKSDNRWHNLRLATRSEQQCNRGAHNGSSSQYRGVSRAGDRWVACISKLGEKSDLGRFAAKLKRPANMTAGQMNCMAPMLVSTSQKHPMKRP